MTYNLCGQLSFDINKNSYDTEHHDIRLKFSIEFEDGYRWSKTEYEDKVLLAMINAAKEKLDEYKDLDGFEAGRVYFQQREDEFSSFRTGCSIKKNKIFRQI